MSTRRVTGSKIQLLADEALVGPTTNEVVLTGLNNNRNAPRGPFYWFSLPTVSVPSNALQEINIAGTPPVTTQLACPKNSMTFANGFSVIETYAPGNFRINLVTTGNSYASIVVRFRMVAVGVGVITSTNAGLLMPVVKFRLLANFAGLAEFPVLPVIGKTITQEETMRVQAMTAAIVPATTYHEFSITFRVPLPAATSGNIYTVPISILANNITDKPVTLEGTVQVTIE